MKKSLILSLIGCVCLATIAIGPLAFLITTGSVCLVSGITLKIINTKDAVKFLNKNAKNINSNFVVEEYVGNSKLTNIKTEQCENLQNISKNSQLEK